MVLFCVHLRFIVLRVVYIVCRNNDDEPHEPSQLSKCCPVTSKLGNNFVLIFIKSASSGKSDPYCIVKVDNEVVAR